MKENLQRLGEIIIVIFAMVFFIWIGVVYERNQPTKPHLVINYTPPEGVVAKRFAE